MKQPESPIRLLLVDDQALIRAGLRCSWHRTRASTW